MASTDENLEYEEARNILGKKLGSLMAFSKSKPGGGFWYVRISGRTCDRVYARTIAEEFVLILPSGDNECAITQLLLLLLLGLSPLGSPLSLDLVQGRHDTSGDEVGSQAVVLSILQLDNPEVRLG